MHTVINKIIIDVDGTLTNNMVWYDSKGERTKAFHCRDIRALVELASVGYEVTLLTASSWPGLKEFAKRTGANVVVARDKKQWVEHNMAPDLYIAVADDSPDIGMLERAFKAFCPSDAVGLVKKIYRITVLRTAGGEGVVAELAQILIHEDTLHHTGV